MTATAVTLAVPCRTDEPAVGRTLDLAWASWCSGPAATGALEVVVCLNGDPGSGCGLADVRAFAGRCGVEAHVVAADGPTSTPWPAPPAVGPAVVALCTARTGKAMAWNRLRRAARHPIMLFMDADVWFAGDTLGRLLAALETSPGAVLASARTRCAPTPSWFEAVMAAPYGVDFPNLSPQLYAARRDALPDAMPEDLLDPERWLELTVGAGGVVRAPGAEVVVRVPATLGDFFRQRVRIEMGRVQLAREHPELLGRGTVQPGPRDVLRQLGPAAVARLGVYMALRGSVHAVARRWYAQGRREDVWPQAGSTKRWDHA
jgi:cellulose synthase/poly-beta-1,6-N-acetylglucosamine synthase-like glycosyltransferase